MLLRLLPYSPSDVLDGGMVTLATFALNIFYPGILLGDGSQWKARRASKSQTSTDIETPDHHSLDRSTPQNK